MTNRQAAYIVAARRTPIGRIGGVLASVPAERLLAPLIQALLGETGIAGERVDDVIVGNAAGPGGNPARLAALEAGLPLDIPGVSVDRQCGSGLEAVNMAASMVKAGAGDIYIAGGVESPSTAPQRAVRLPDGSHRFINRARFSPDVIGDPEMGVAAENVAERCGITRDRQDRFALSSHQKAVAAIAAGLVEDEIVPIVAAKGQTIVADQCPRPDTSLERLASLPPVFVPGGTVTAGNACPVNDGAALVLVVSERVLKQLQPAAALRHVDCKARGVDPNVLGLGPIAATRALLDANPGVAIGSLDLVEFNEAFASQVLACLDALDIDPALVNPGGGALAFGHPWGASGAILAVRLYSQMVRRRGVAGPVARRALATIGIGGGLGISTLFEPA